MPKFTVTRTWYNIEAKNLIDAVEKTKNTLHDEINVVKHNDEMSSGRLSDRTSPSQGGKPGFNSRSEQTNGR